MRTIATSFRACPGLGWRPGRLAGAVYLAVLLGRPAASAAQGRDGGGRVAPIRAATVAAVLAEARASKAPAVLVNVWATWCDPCREEMPDLLRFYRDHRAQGLRLVLLSADDEDAGASVTAALADAGSKAGVTGALDAQVYLKGDDDMKLIDGLDPRWSGALPATFMFDRDGRRIQSWLAPVSYAELERSVGPRLTKPRAEAKTKTSRPSPPSTTGATAPPSQSSPQGSRRKP